MVVPTFVKGVSCTLVSILLLGVVLALPSETSAAATGTLSGTSIPDVIPGVFMTKEIEEELLKKGGHESVVNNAPDSTEVKTDGLRSCFDFYRFGSTPAVITSTLSQAAQGGAVPFTVILKNENQYPIKDVAVYAKIFKVTNEDKDLNGPDVVDWIKVTEGVDIDASASSPFTFAWKVPASATPGTYRAATYVVASDRFNMLGLTFTDDIVGNSTDFSVIGNEDKKSVMFQKGSVTVDGQPYFFAAFPPRVATGPTTIQAVLENPTTVHSSVASSTLVHWEVYSWDGVRASQLLTTKEERVSLKMGESRTIKLVVNDTTHSVYFVRAVAKTGGHTDSILGIRFKRSENSAARLNFMGVNNDVLKGTSDTEAFVCAHSVSAVPADGKLVLSAHRMGNNILANLFGTEELRQEYSGALSGDIRALTLPLRGMGTSFTLASVLYDKNGSVVDELSYVYGCNEDGTCAADRPYLTWIILGGILLLCALGASLFIRHRRVHRFE